VERENKVEAPNAEVFRSGLTYRSFLGLLYCSLTLMPVAIFSTLVTGMSLAAAGMPVIGFVAVFLSSEVARFSGAKLTQQELFIIWSQSLVATGSILALGIFHQFYFRSISPVTKTFFIGDKSLPSVIPDWWAPPPSSDVLTLRTLFHRDWLLPFLLYGVLYFSMWRIVDPVIGFICYQLFAVSEKLPFPISQVQAETCSTLSERDSQKINLLVASSILSAFYAFLTYFPPFVLNLPNIIPIPWVDLNTSIEKILPGASFGIGTDLLSLAIGMMLPSNVVASMLVGSIFVWLIGNPILVKYGLYPEWSPGSDVGYIFERSTLAFWAFPVIGLTFAASVIPFLMRARIVTQSLRSLVNLSNHAKKFGMWPLKKLVLVYLSICTAVFFLFKFFLTDFPWFLLVFLIYGWNFFAALISTRAFGETGMSMAIPYVNETIILLSG